MRISIRMRHEPTPAHKKFLRERCWRKGNRPNYWERDFNNPGINDQGIINALQELDEIERKGDAP